MPKFLIGNYQVGLEDDLKPWLLADDAFPEMEDVYIWRGRIKKRVGYRLLGRLVDSGNVTLNTPVMGLGLKEEVSPQEINNEELIAFNLTNANRYNITTSSFEDISNFINSGTAFTWTGTNSDFFWTTNYANAFWATNGLPGFYPNSDDQAGGSGDGIRWFGIAAGLGPPIEGWANFTPPISPTEFLLGALVILPYKNRLVVLNTFEGTASPGTHRPQRVRWCQLGTPYYDTGPPIFAPDPFNAQVDSWRSDPGITGKGGFGDIPTNEAIISAELIKDSLLIFCERSVWRLAYTGNEFFPFAIEQVNNELGCESTKSVVGFDDKVLAVGDRAIIGANQNNVQRIDEKIPDLVFEFQNKSFGQKRVAGIRDFKREMVYWAYPQAASPNAYTRIFPNQILAYNYRNGSYSIWSAFFTTFGYFNEKSDRTWAESTFPWSGTNYTWISGLNQSQTPLVIGGNQQGFVHILDDNLISDNMFRITNLSNTDPITVDCANHNLEVGEVIEFNSIPGFTQINPLNEDSPNIEGLRIRVDGITNADQFTIDLNGTLYNPFTLFSEGFIRYINGFNLLSKRFNPFIQEDLAVEISSIDLYLQATTRGEFTFDVYTDQNDTTASPNLFVNTTSRFQYELTYTVSTDADETLQGNIGQDNIWVRTFVYSNGQFLQFRFYQSEAQLVNKDLSNPQFSLNALILNANPHGRLI